MPATIVAASTVPATTMVVARIMARAVIGSAAGERRRHGRNDRC